MKNITHKIIFTAACMYIFTSCMRDIDDLSKISTHIHSESSWTIPVAYSNLSIHDLKDRVNQEIGEDKDGLIMITYMDTVVSGTAEEMLVLPDQEFHEHFSFDPSEFRKATFTHEFHIRPFEAQEINVDSIILNNIELNLALQVTAGIQGSIELSVPELTNSNGHFKTDMIIDASGAATFNTNLQGYKLVLNEISAETNDLLLEMTLTINSIVPEAIELDFNASMRNIKYEWYFGTTGEILTPIGPSTVSVEVFRNLFFGTFYIENPVLRCAVYSTFGGAVRYGFDYMIAKNNNTSFESQVTGLPDYETSPHTILKAQHSYPSTTITEVSDIFELNSTNSNLPILMSNMVNSFEYKLNALINPSNSAVSDYFVHKDSRLTVIGEIDIPLYGSAHAYIADTLNFTLGEDLPDMKEIEELRLKLVTSNGFPCDFKLSGVLVDSVFTPVDTLFGSTDKQMILKQGIIGSDGKINQQTGRGYQDTTINMTNARIKNWNKAKQLIFEAEIVSSGNPQSVKFFSHYGIEIKLIADVDIMIDERF